MSSRKIILCDYCQLEADDSKTKDWIIEEKITSYGPYDFCCYTCRHNKIQEKIDEHKKEIEKLTEEIW